jgi:hypothetical protein
MRHFDDNFRRLPRGALVEVNGGSLQESLLLLLPVFRSLPLRDNVSDKNKDA